MRHSPTKNSLHCGGRLFVSYPFLSRDVYIIDIIRWREVITKLGGKDLACFKINRKDGSRFIDPVSPSTCVREIFADSKISTSTGVSAFKSNLLVHTYPDSLSVRLLTSKGIFGSCENFIAEHYFASFTCLRRLIRATDIERSQGHRLLKKPQNVEPPFGIIELYRIIHSCTVVIAS